MEKGWAVLILHAAASFMRMEAQRFQCAGEGRLRAGAGGGGRGGLK